MADTNNRDCDAAGSETESIAPSSRRPAHPSILDLHPNKDHGESVFWTVEDVMKIKELEERRKVAPEDTEPGMFCGIKNLYEGPPRCGCCINWIEEYPDDTKTAIDDQAQRYAILVRNKKGHEGTKPMVIDSIEVRSPLLKLILKEVFDGFEGITVTLKTLTFRRPFAPFFYRWERFKKAAEHHDDKIALSHIQLLYKTLKEELHETISTYHDLVDHQVITYDFLWTIFVPGEFLFSVQDGQDLMLKLQDSNYVTGPSSERFVISSKFVDWDGHEFGFRSCPMSIQPFENTKPISQLDAYPARFRPNLDETRKRLVDRGIQFEALKGHHFKAYSGLAFQLDDHFLKFWGMDSKMTLDSRIVIDAELFHQTHTVRLESLEGTSFRVQVQEDEHAFRHYHGSQEDEYENPWNTDLQADYLSTSSRIRKSKSTRQKKPNPVSPELNEEQHLLCSPFVKGYSLKEKMWVRILVDGVKEISWNDNAFDNLVLPPGHKELILSFIRSQNSRKNIFDDLIQGKGRGIVMLLCGNPGVGKTLTAEAVAEKLKVPLYSVSGSELGVNSAHIEVALERILEMTTRWNAVLLLDESDVFLEQRSIDDLERNRVVSIFLRMLEYYTGVLFMTTNRASVLDKAIESRIHIRINFPELNAASRRQIWRNFIQLLPEANVKLNEKDLDLFAERPMNGRQIKNVIKAAELLSIEQQQPLGFTQIDTVLRITQAGGDL